MRRRWLCLGRACCRSCARRAHAQQAQVDGAEADDRAAQARRPAVRRVDGEPVGKGEAKSRFELAVSPNKRNEIVNLDSLVKKGLLHKPKFPLKILGNGKVNVKLTVQAHAFTKVAKQKIEDAGGSCELINNK